MQPRQARSSMPRTALVTGGGTGIGRAIVLALLKRGWRVGAFDINEELLADLVAEANTDRLTTGVLDVADADGWATALATLCGDGPLDALVNNAGILQSGRFEEIPLATQLRTIDVNVKGMLTGCHTSHTYLARSERANVINIASASAIYGQAELATYSATKFAVRGLSEALDLEWGPQGIRVQAIWPLYVQSAMTKGLDIGTTRSLGIRLTPETVAKTVVKALESERTKASIHRPVGLQAAASLWSAGLSPSWVLRRVNRKLAER